MKKLFFLSLLLILSTAIFAQVAEQPAKRSNTKKKELIEEDTLPKVPVIKFKSLVHDYGNIYKNDNGVCTFEFTNAGKADLQLTNVSSSCGCTVPDWPKDPIPPGQSAAIKVSYDTKRVGGISRSVHVDSNTGERVTLSIRGNVSERPQEIIPESKTSPLMNNN
ncbi:MAG: DUF1573 domain-containing protein [Bacteroidetes bacterium]|nr:DUF1573 domain-containing protein [Bacteroidota bacterium]MCL2303186.1 DUF1573 domain-containing protein [Lentimicrobiaceae bacterium]